MSRQSPPLLLIAALVTMTGCSNWSPPAYEESGQEQGAVAKADAQPRGTQPRPVAPPDIGKMNTSISEFGTVDGRRVDLFTLTNRDGLVLKVTNYGATVVSMEVPDRDGNLKNVTLGFPTLEGYLGDHPYFGATVGRYCNRIAQGKFELDGQAYELATNNGPNHLHGGENGFNRKIWSAGDPREGLNVIQNEKGVGITLDYTSPDGEEGYPGSLRVEVTYFLSNDNEMQYWFVANSDAPTVVNLTNHNYWNLAGADSGATILDHELTLAADSYLPVDETLIPTGKIAPVEGTPMDFQSLRTIGERIEELEGDPRGYDHCYVLRPAADDQPRLAARIEHKPSGRVMEVLTTQPGIQFYTGNFLDGSPVNGGFQQYQAFCLETQHYPDSPNQADFPSVVLKPDQTFYHQTIHRFTVE